MSTHCPLALPPSHSVSVEEHDPTHAMPLHVTEVPLMGATQGEQDDWPQEFGEKSLEHTPAQSW